MPRFAGGAWSTRCPSIWISPPFASSRPAIKSKQGCLSATGRPDKDRELLLLDLKIDIPDDFDFVKSFRQPFKFDVGHDVFCGIH